MKNKTINFLIFCICLLGLNSGYLVSSIYGSGTYCPLPSCRIYEFSHEEIEQGKLLFEGRQLIGSNGKTCNSCHEDDRATPLTRASLKKKAEQLGYLINQCLEDATRSAGSPLEWGSQQMIQQGAYLISRYRLPLDTIKYLKSKPGNSSLIQ